MAALESYGIRNVVCLRYYFDDKDEAKKTNLILHRHKLKAGDISVEDVIHVLRLIKGMEGPVLIHCKHGSDRTGALSAAYRIVYEGWSPQAALDELKNGGYGFHTIFKSIPALILNTDWESVKKRVMAP